MNFHEIVCHVTADIVSPPNFSLHYICELYMKGQKFLSKSKSLKGEQDVSQSAIRSRTFNSDDKNYN